MTKLLILFAAMSFTSALAGAQELSENIFKGARVVYVKNTLTADENYTLAGKALVALEYGIGKNEKEFGLIESKDLSMRDPVGSPHIQRFDITVQDSLVKIVSHTAFNHSNYGGDNQLGTNYALQPLVFRKKVFGGLGLFQGLVNIAQKIEGQIFYSK